MSFPRSLNSRFAEFMPDPKFQRLVVKEAVKKSRNESDDEILSHAFDEIYPEWMWDFEKRAEFVGDSVVVYRGISADTVEDLDLNNVGVYWTWDRDKAANYSNENTKKNLFVVKATAGINDIHLKDTLKKIVWDGYTHEESERELQINKKAKLNLIEIIGPDKTYPVKSKTATARVIAALKSVVAGVEDADYPYFHVSDHPEIPKPHAHEDTTHNALRSVVASQELIVERATALRKVTATKADELIKKADKIVKNKSYLNCRLFTQLVTDTPKIENQPQLDQPETGAIMWWGVGGQYRHCAVALDDDTVIQVPEWGGEVEVVPLSDVEKEYGPVERIYKGS